MNKKILIGIIALIAIVAVCIGAYVLLNEEPVPDFKVNGETVEVNETFTLPSNTREISIKGENFTIPKGYSGNLSYIAGNPKADLSNEDSYLSISSLGEGNVTELANQYVENNKGLSIGDETKEGNITIIEISQGSDVISHFYYIQIGNNVYEINMYGLELNDVINT